MCAVSGVGSPLGDCRTLSLLDSISSIILFKTLDTISHCKASLARNVSFNLSSIFPLNSDVILKLQISRNARNLALLLFLLRKTSYMSDLLRYPHVLFQDLLLIQSYRPLLADLLYG